MALFSSLLGLLLAPAHALAQGIDTNLRAGWDSGICAILTCAGAGGAATLSNYLNAKVVASMQVIFMVITLLMMLLVYGSTMVLQSQDEGVVKEMKTAYIYAITGCVVVSLASIFVNAFSPTEAGSNLVNGAPIVGAIGNIVTYFKLVLATALSVNTVVQSFRLLNSQGAQEQVDKARKRLVFGFVGVGIVLIANVIVMAVNPDQGAHLSLVATEIRGIANFLVTLFGFGLVVAMIVAGVLLIVSVSDGLKDKAKNIIKTALFGLIAILVSYAIVILFIGLG